MSQLSPEVAPAEPFENTEHSGPEASVWRLGPGGLLLSSVVARHAADLAEREPNTIFFYAELGGPTELKNTEETNDKVFRALASAGLSEGQIVTAVNKMQSAGIYFREAAF